MAKQQAARCSPCDLNFPRDQGTCWACDKPTWLADDEDFPKDWKALASARRRLLKPGSPIPNITDAVTPAIGNRLFVADRLLREAGYEPETGVIVCIRDQFYELVGVYNKTDATTGGGWILDEVDPEAEFADLPVLAGNPPSGG